MSIYKKIKGKDVKVADDKVLDHSQLSGRDSYGAHPISAIRNLPEKLTKLKNKDEEIEIKAGGIDIVENAGGTISLTRYDGTERVVRCGYLPDGETIQLQNNDDTFDKLTAVALQTRDGNISGQDIKEEFVNLKSVVNAKGGYLDSYDFQTASPTQEQLTSYALQDIGAQSVVEIWDKTRVINLYVDREHPNQDTWIWDLRSQSWSNLGNISFVSDANNSGLHGLVTGAPNDGDHDFMGNITALGQIQINGLPEFAQEVEQELIGKQAADLVFSDSTVSSWTSDNTYSGYGYKGTIYLNGVDATMIPSVIFDITQATNGEYLPIVESFNGGVYIWAKTTTSINIPLIKVQKTQW